jgi:predicted nucleic acid-binding protein
VDANCSTSSRDRRTTPRDRLTGPLVAWLTGRAWCGIAATCLSHNLPLATHNTKDFQDFADREDLTLL